ncbi:hypothetical protein BDZ89DRAFT_1137546 [Hymenopellis radicata]|nr:hypothetical protein BDZ89DRAFT_1137546 [Hymenopellis radicata]
MARARRESRSKANGSTRRRRAAAKKATKAQIAPPPAPSPSQSDDSNATPRVIHLEDLVATDDLSRVEFLPAGYVPRRPNNGYFKYLEICARQPSHGVRVAQRTVVQGHARKWNELEPEEQKIYKEIAEAETVIVKARFPDYKYAVGAKDRMSRNEWEECVDANGVHVPREWSVETDHLFAVDANGALRFTGEPPVYVNSDSDNSPGPETPTNEVQSFNGYPYPTSFEAIQYCSVSTLHFKDPRDPLCEFAVETLQYQPSTEQYSSSSESSPSPSFSSWSPNTLSQEFAGAHLNPYSSSPFIYNSYTPLTGAPYFAGSSHMAKQPTSSSSIYDLLLELNAQECYGETGIDAYYANVDFASAFDYSLSL